MNNYLEVILQILAYVGLAGLFAPFFLSLFKPRGGMVSKSRDSKVLGFWLVFVIWFKNLSLVSSIKSELIENLLIVITFVLIAIVDSKYRQIQPRYRITPLYLIPILDLLRYQDFIKFIGPLLLCYLYAILDRIDIGHFMTGILNGIRLFIYSSIVFSFLFLDRSFQLDIGNSVFQFLGVQGRYQGIFTHPNGLAIVLCLYFAIQGKRKFLESGLVAMMIVSTGSQAAIICSLTLLIYYKLKRSSKQRLLFVFAIVNLVLPFIAQMFFSWIPRIVDRKIIWDISLSSIGSSPLIGNGSEFLRSLTESGDLPPYAAQAHSQLVNISVSFGILGASIFLWAYLKLIRNSWKRLEYGLVTLTLLIFGLTESPVSELNIFSIPSILFITTLRGGEMCESANPRTKSSL